MPGRRRTRQGAAEEGAEENRGGTERPGSRSCASRCCCCRVSFFVCSRSPSRRPLPRLGGLGDFGARSLARLLPRLRAVDLRGHSRLTPVGVAALAANARCLRALWLGGGGVGGGAAATQRASFDSSSLLDSAASDAGVAAAVVGAGATLELLFVEAPAVSPAVRRQQQRTGVARNRGGAAANAAAAATAAAAGSASYRGEEEAAAALHAAAACDHDALTAAALAIVAVHAPRIRRLSLRGVEWGRGRAAVAAAAAAAGTRCSSPSGSPPSLFLLLPELEELDVSTPSPSSPGLRLLVPGCRGGRRRGLVGRRGAAARGALRGEAGVPEGERDAAGGPGVCAALRRASGSLRELRVVGCSGFGREQLRALGGGARDEERDGGDGPPPPRPPPAPPLSLSPLPPPPLPLSLLDVRGCESLERATAEDWRCGLGLEARRKERGGATKSRGCETLLRELAVGCRPPAAAEAAAALFFSAADADAILLGDGSLAVSAALTALGRADGSSSRTAAAGAAAGAAAAATSAAPLLEKLTLRGARLSCADALAVGSLPSLASLDVSGCVPEVTASTMNTTAAAATEGLPGADGGDGDDDAGAARGGSPAGRAGEGREARSSGRGGCLEGPSSERPCGTSTCRTRGPAVAAAEEQQVQQQEQQREPRNSRLFSSPLPLSASSPLALLLAETPRLA